MPRVLSLAKTKSSELPDEVDIRILDILRTDGRATLANVGKQVGLSKPSVKYRVNRLAKFGIIKGFFALVDSQAYGRDLSVMLDLTVEAKHIEEIAQRIAGFDEVTRTYELFNSPELHVHALFSTQNEMERFLKEKLYPVPWITSIRTGIIMKRYKYEPSLTV